MPTWTSVKTKILKLDQKNVLNIIKDLYSLNENNKRFIQTKLNSDNSNNRDYYKKIIHDAIHLDYRKINEKIEFSKARKAISDYKKASGDLFGVADLMTYYVEVGCNQAQEIAVDYEQYYDSLESMLAGLITILKKNESFIELFRSRLEYIKEIAIDGYGHKDNVEDLLEEVL